MYCKQKDLQQGVGLDEGDAGDVRFLGAESACFRWDSPFLHGAPVSGTTHLEIMWDICFCRDYVFFRAQLETGYV